MEYPKYKKVLFCTDFSENSDYAFEFAYGIVKRDKSLFCIIHVIHHDYQWELMEALTPAKILDKIRKDIEEDVDNQYREHYVKKIENGIRFQTITKSGKEDREIIKFAKKEKIDIIVMGTHGRTAAEHIFVGSIAEKVIRHSPLPVLIIPSRRKIETL